MLLLPGTATPPAALAPLAALLPRAVIGARDVQTNRALLDDGVVFGWSSGAFTALSLAAMEPAVTRLILFEPPYRADDDRAPGQGAIFLRLLAWEALGQRTRALDAFWELVTARGDGLRGASRISNEQRKVLYAYRGPLLAPLFSSMGREAPLPPVPTRIGLGAESAPPMRAAVERLRCALPNAAVELVEGVDHLGPYTHPEVIAAWASRT